jgi:pimeloyl-ACP methyl ester carboxylesterase
MRSSPSAPIDPSNDPAGFWLGLRSAVAATIYPDGIPTKAATISVSPVEPPTGASSVVRMAFADPGGRTGGTEARADWVSPIAARCGRIVTFVCGHNFGGSWPDTIYCDDDGSSIPLRLLADGCDVIMLDMPAYGINPIPQVVVIDGEAVEVTSSHPYGDTVTDGGPSGNRLFTDPAIWTLDYVLSQVSGRTHLVGHSGGAASGAIIAACDTRYDTVVLMQSGFSFSAGSPNEFEMWSVNPAAQATPNKSWAGIVRASTAVQNRRSVFWYAPQDEYDPNQTAYWRGVFDRDSVWLPRCVSGASVSLQLKTDAEDGSYHSITPSQCAAVVADILSH